MKLTYDPFWQKVHAYPLDFLSLKLSQENNWDTDLIKRAIAEYKRFIYLCCALPNGATPSPLVETVWQTHLLYTEDYWEEFCKKTLGKKIHHPIEKHRLKETLQHYKSIFGELPPKDIWGKTRVESINNAVLLTRWVLPFGLLSYGIFSYSTGAQGIAVGFFLFAIILFIIFRTPIEE